MNVINWIKEKELFVIFLPVCVVVIVASFAWFIGAMNDTEQLKAEQWGKIVNEKHCKHTGFTGLARKVFTCDDKLRLELDLK